MSTVRANQILDAAGGNTATINGMTPTAQSLQGFRNRIINGDMRIDQRNAGASVTPADGAYTLDRWQARQTVTSKFSVQQNAASVTPPSGFTNYLGVTSLSAYSVGSSDLFAISQHIEGFNTADLGWGSAAAQTVTLSFWVRSSLTGTFGGSLRNNGGDRQYPFSFSIAAANTWEYKTVSVAGDTTGTWATGNTTGIRFSFGLGVGSTFSSTAGVWGNTGAWSATGATSVVGTNGATFYITGVQLEAGSVATPFEQIDYGRELMLCQRYYQKSYPQGNKTGDSTSAGAIRMRVNASTGVFLIEGTSNYLVTMRTIPTFTIYASTSGNSNNITNSGSDLSVTNVFDGGDARTPWPLVASTPSTTNDLSWQWTASAEL